MAVNFGGQMWRSSWGGLSGPTRGRLDITRYKWLCVGGLVQPVWRDERRCSHLGASGATEGQNKRKKPKRYGLAADFRDRCRGCTMDLAKCTYVLTHTHRASRTSPLFGVRLRWRNFVIIYSCTGLVNTSAGLCPPPRRARTLGVRLRPISKVRPSLCGPLSGRPYN